MAYRVYYNLASFCDAFALLDKGGDSGAWYADVGFVLLVEGLVGVEEFFPRFPDAPLLLRCLGDVGVDGAQLHAYCTSLLEYSLELGFAVRLKTDH